MADVTVMTMTGAVVLVAAVSFVVVTVVAMLYSRRHVSFRRYLRLYTVLSVWQVHI